MKSDVDKIIDVLNEIDMDGFVKNHAHREEYAPEARILLDRVASGQRLTAQYVRDVWLVMFASMDYTTSSEGCRHFNRNVSRVRVGDMPMHPEFEVIAERVNALFPLRGTR